MRMRKGLEKHGYVNPNIPEYCPALSIRVEVGFSKQGFGGIKRSDGIDRVCVDCDLYCKIRIIREL